MYTDHSSLKYLVKKPVLGGKICQWILLFQELDFEVIVNPGRLNSRPDHMSRIESGEEHGNLDESLPNPHLFEVNMFNDHYRDISHVEILTSNRLISLTTNYN